MLKIRSAGEHVPQGCFASIPETDIDGAPEPQHMSARGARVTGSNFPCKVRSTSPFTLGGHVEIPSLSSNESQQKGVLTDRDRRRELYLGVVFRASWRCFSASRQ